MLDLTNLCKVKSFRTKPRLIIRQYSVQLQLHLCIVQYILMDSQKSNRKAKYATISLTRRKMLINEVIEKGKSVNSSAKKFGIKCSTAKIIVRRFKETGTIYVRNKGQGIQIYGINDLSQLIIQKGGEVKRQQNQNPQIVVQQRQNGIYPQNSTFCLPQANNYWTEFPFAPVLPVQPCYYLFWQ